MKTAEIYTAPEPTEAEIQHAAYLLWVENGRPEGCDLQHWNAAKEFLLHHHGRSPTPSPRRARITARAAAPIKA